MRRGRLVILVAAAAMAGNAAPAGAAAPPKVRPLQELAVLLEPHEVRAIPRARPSHPVTIPAWAPITGGATVLPVIGHATTGGGVRWLRVMLPGRPNGATGWIAQRATRSNTTSWRIAIRTAARQVRVYRRGELVRTFSAVVGKPSTPTPHGRFFIEESIAMPQGSAGAPYALATSARSNVLHEYGGGPGQIALHGVMNLGGVPGTAVSHGCVRLANPHIRWLAARISPGVPVTITR
jgi:lipoprotein-anchoring transpeptidase ErfK/SrfK